MIGSLFRKNEKSLLDAWQQVLDEADPTDWALFGYESQSDSLQLLATGDQGLDELALEVNPGQVMYAFVRVVHPKTKITTFVIINWVGEGAPIQRKATSAAHQFEVRKFFKYSNLCIHARLEEDVEEANVLEQLAKSATTDYDFDLKSSALKEDIKPVGTNYVRVKADKEINLKDRNNFWSKMEAEERKRKQEEIKAIEEEKRKEEKNRKEREIRASKAREELLRLQEEQLEEQRKAEALIQEKKKVEQQRLEEPEEKKVPETVRTVNKFQMDVALNEREKFWAQQEEEERARRLEEQHRKDLLKDEQLNSIANIKNKFSQMNEKTPEEKQVKNNFETNNGHSNQVINENLNNGNSFSLNANGKVTHLTSPTKFTDIQDISQCESLSLQETNLDEELNVETGLHKNSSLLQEEDEELYDDQLDNDYCLDNSVHLGGYGGVRWASSDRLEVIAEEEEEEQDNLKILLAGKGLCAKAIYDYQADDDQEISFDPDDIITNIKQTFDTWWEGLGPDNKFGLFPANYVELLN